MRSSFICFLYIHTNSFKKSVDWQLSPVNVIIRLSVWIHHFSFKHQKEREKERKRNGDSSKAQLLYVCCFGIEGFHVLHLLEKHGAGFCPHLRGFFENGRPLIPRLRFFFLSFFLLVEISSRTLITLFMPGSVHSGSAR